MNTASSPVALLAVALAGVVAVDAAGRHRIRARVRSAPAVQLPRPLAEAMAAAGATDPVALLCWWAGAVVVLMIVGIATAPALVVLGVTLGIAGPFALVVQGRRAGRRRAEQLPVAIESVASAMRGGAGLAQAVGSVRVGDPLDAELADLTAAVDRGLSFEDAVSRWRARQPDAGTALAAGCLVVAARTGGRTATALDQAARSLRQRRAVEAEGRALATQSQLSAWVLVALPVLFTAAMTSIDPDIGAFLVGTPLGLACIAVGAALDGLGAWWMHRIVTGARP